MFGKHKTFHAQNECNNEKITSDKIRKSLKFAFVSQNKNKKNIQIYF